MNNQNNRNRPPMQQNRPQGQSRPQNQGRPRYVELSPEEQAQYEAYRRQALSFIESYDLADRNARKPNAEDVLQRKKLADVKHMKRHAAKSSVKRTLKSLADVCLFSLLCWFLFLHKSGCF